ncbi:tape measure domain-containing protein [Bacillus thermophilus]|uniref:Tape measure domain-containing protein n=1 Tax=Siminovitchia thermophila TaxID=1245522 RepID=A0ABS2RDF1_9BACI|nr:tape measure protein [Siminovitchia thermophila]MBM7717204.1 tape measure domain-containing protein [Siminovitchia thermophila]
MADYTLTAKLIADAKGFQAGFQRAQASLANLQNKVSSVGNRFSSIGKSISGVGDKLTRSITIPAVGATSALTGVTLVKGFNRLVGIDTAKAKLKGLGHDAGSVENIMNSALESVKGTSYGLDEAATTAASAVAAGIKPGKELTRYLSLTGDAAAIAGAGMDEMGAIFNKVQTAQRAYTGDLNMLADRGLPIYQWLAEEAGTTAEAIRDMASEGKISSEMFLNAIEKNIGGAAKIMGQESFTAAIANIWASVARIGANFLDAGGKGGGFFSTMKPLLADFNERLGVVEDKAADLGVKFGEAFNAFLTKAGELKAKFDELSPSMQGLVLKAIAIGAGFMVGIGPALKIVGTLTSGFGSLISFASLLLSPIGLVVAGITALAVVFGVAMATSEEFRGKVFGAFQSIQEVVSNVVSVVLPILQNMWTGAVEGVQTFASEIGGKLLSIFETIGNVITTVVEAIGQFVSSIVDGFQGAGGQVNTLSALFLGFNPVLKIAMLVLSEFGPQIATGFSEIASMAMPLLTLLGESLGQLAAAVIPMVMNVISALLPIVVNLGTTIMEIAMAVIPILIDVFMQLLPVVMSLVETIAGIISKVAPLVSVLIGALLPVLTMLIETIMNIVQAVAPALIAIIEAVIAVFDAIIPVIMAVLSVVVDVLANIIAAITPIISFVAMVISTIISIIAPIVTFIAGVIKNIFSAITPIITFVSGVFSTVFSVISKVFRNVLNTITGVIRTISSVISTLSSVVSRVFSKIFSIATRIMDKVSSVISGVFDGIRNAWDGLTGFVSGVFDGIQGAVETLVSQVKGFVNGVIEGINAAIGLINKIPGVSISKIPQLARGTDDWAGGFARINEGGRGELVMLPSGTQVIPHDVSMRYAREAGRSHSQLYQDNSDFMEPVSGGGSKEIIIPVVLEGREIARVTAPYMDRELGRKRSDRTRAEGGF